MATPTFTDVTDLSGGRRLKDKRILVTGAAAGIGRATALRLVQEGAHVIATDWDASGLSSLAPCMAQVCQLDICNAEGIRQLAGGIGPLNGLFNCVGIVSSGSVLDCTDEDWSHTLQVNATSCFHMIRAFLPAMLAQGGGSIVNVASIVSSLKGAPNRFAYGASKAAIIGITKSVAADFVTAGIRCNAICPGTVKSPSLEARLRATGDFDKALAEFEARQPMGRLAMPEEIAGLAALLLSDDATFITGQAYAADGGWSI